MGQNGSQIFSTKSKTEVIMDDFEKKLETDAENKFSDSITDDKLKDVSFWAEKQLELEAIATEMEEKLADIKKELKAVIEQHLPDAMRECNLQEIKLANGAKISIQQYYSARIGKEREEEAFSWLKQNGHDDIIKNVVSMQFGRGEDESAESIMADLQAQGFSPSTKRWVEPMTLKAFVREQVESGVDLPFETFNIYIGQKAKIKKD